MKDMAKGLTVPKLVLINRLKIPQNLSAQFVCSSPKVLDFNEKKASLGVRSPWFPLTSHNCCDISRLRLGTLDTNSFIHANFQQPIHNFEI